MRVAVACPTCKEERAVEMPSDMTGRYYAQHRECRSCANKRAHWRKVAAAKKMAAAGVEHSRISKMLRLPATMLRGILKEET